MGKHRSLAEYNANNAWLYNGNNGNVNNNNKYNSNGVRPVLESDYVDTDSLSRCFIPLQEWYDVYRLCRRNCNRKTLHLHFRADFLKNIVELCNDVGGMEYVPRQGVCFVITRPRLREVIAADFADKMVQTWYCERVMPLLEKHCLHEDSYACRKGKGGLRAVLRLQDYVFEASNGYTTDVWLAKVDFKGFFMSIDTKTATNELSEFIAERTDGELRNWLLWMTRIIYLSQPQLHCRMQSPMWMEYQLPEHKRMLGREGYEGIAIGNRTSQMLALFRTTFFLSLLVGMGYKFVLYTDDCCVVVTDKAKWLADRRRLALMVREKGLTLHPDKVYLQHYSKGVEMLGYKLRFGRMLPSDRIVHNFKWKTQCAARRLEARANWYDLEGLQQTVNSYLGLLGWCNSYRLRRDTLETLKNGVCGRFYDFAEDYTKITIKTPYKRVMHFVRANNERKRSYKLWLKS